MKAYQRIRLQKRNSFASTLHLLPERPPSHPAHVSPDFASFLSAIRAFPAELPVTMTSYSVDLEPWTKVEVPSLPQAANEGYCKEPRPEKEGKWRTP